MSNDLLAVADTAVLTDPKPSAPAPGSMPPSQNVTINLINRLVKKGVLGAEEAAELIQQAEEDAAHARVEAAAVAVQAAQEVQAHSAEEAPPSDDTVRVTYIPETVKAQMREQIKQEIMAKARDENWAAPRSMPEWTQRIKVLGDVRVRYEGQSFPSGNDNTGAFPNFNAINTGSPFDVAGTVFSPQLNVDQDRNRFRLRARLGVEADLGDGFTAGFRLGTGESNTPVTQNQSLGAANQGQGGNFSKYAIWLDRGYLKYENSGPSGRYLGISVGRFDNPFFTVSPMMWQDEIGFDGAVLQARYEVAKGFTPFLTAGAFPIFNTDLNFSSNRPDKFKSDDKYLYAGQLGTTWKITKDIVAKFGAAYYHFDNVEGRLSDPYVPLTAQDAGNTDNLRPSFAQSGNTYMALRNIIPTVDNDFGTSKQFQYFGLATPYHDLALTGKIDFNHFEPVQISLFGEYIKNLAFDGNDINLKAVNNRGDSASGSNFDGGDTAWIVGLKVGNPALEKRWDWNTYLNYRHVESDAIIDGFTDSDFGGTLAGTNHEGFTLGGNLSLSPRVWLGLRWMSANEIAGTPYKNDVVQFDVNGKF